jgi:tetratricopeptide (TPR) repeat protein
MESMTRTTVLAALCAAFIATSPAMAQGPRFSADMDELARGWAHVNYDVRDKKAEAAEAQRLAARAEELVQRYPDRAEPLAWEALALLSEADAHHSMRSLELCRGARKLLERAAKIDPDALGPGVIYANLGSLYGQLPGFPLSFGDARKARAYFDKAIAANPYGLDANYFYADFLNRQGEHARAMQLVERALAAPSRPGHEALDRGRKWEAAELQGRIRHKVKDTDSRLAEAAAAARR